MTTEERIKALVALKLDKITDRIQHEFNTDWEQTYSKRDFRPDELDETADKYVTTALLQELYFKSSKSLAK